MTGGQLCQFHLTQTVLAPLLYEALFARSDIRKSAGNCSPCAEDKGSNGSVSDHSSWHGGLGPEQTQAQPALLSHLLCMTHGMGEGYIRDLPRSGALGEEKFGLPGCGK